MLNIYTWKRKNPVTFQTIVTDEEHNNNANLFFLWYKINNQFATKKKIYNLYRKCVSPLLLPMKTKQVFKKMEPFARPFIWNVIIMFLNVFLVK